MADQLRIDAAAAAAMHLLGHCLTPIFDRETAQDLWRSGYPHLVARIAVSEVCG
jgi:hypothetical protein